MWYRFKISQLVNLKQKSDTGLIKSVHTPVVSSQCFLDIILSNQALAASLVWQNIQEPLTRENVFRIVEVKAVIQSANEI